MAVVDFSLLLFFVLDKVLFLLSLLVTNTRSHNTSACNDSLILNNNLELHRPRL